MIQETETLVEALRKELQEYAGLMQVFDQQQRSIMGRDPALFLSQNALVDEQLQKIAECRQNRERMVHEMAARVSRPADSTLGGLLPSLPAAFRPLLQALMNEINDLIGRSHRRTQQNRMLLSQSLDLARQRLSAVDPHALPGTYSSHGALQGVPGRSSTSAQVA